MEISAVDLLYAGSAGLVAMLREAGGIVSLAIGNSLSRFGRQMPFYLGRVGAGAGVDFLAATKELS